MKKTSPLKTKTNIIETCMVYFKFGIQKINITREKIVLPHSAFTD